uniref:Contactin-associated protein-like 2 (Trinotate prediction) n=1 Tax=Henneguya salminicola TaxID=69463 RepID=A0A6G3MDG1_HENSL
MKLLTCFVLVLFHIEEINAAWNISENGFLLNSLRYSNIRNTDYFSVVFWTTNHNGILLYCEGKDNYLLLELYHAVIRLSVNYIGQERQEPYEGYVGSGLADNKPHQIEIYRESHSIMLVLDRGEQTALVSWPVVSSSQLLFKISTAYLGGYNDMSIFNRFMSLSKTGFIGCIEEGIWNNVNLLFEPYANNSVSFCTLTSYDPISFLSPTSFITLNRKEHATGLTLIFDIMIYLNYSTILFHNNNLSTLNISITNGSFFMSLDFGNVNYINAFLPMIKINDGQWHRIAVQLPGKNSLETPIVVFGVDNEIVTTYSSFTYDASRDIKFGGFGFIGCINNLVVDGESFIMGLSSETRDVDNNGCHFPDQCVPNPCQHAGFCTLNVNSFNCQCPLSYPGVVCEDAKYYLTCSNMYLCDHKIPGKQLIDVDGIGPFDPVPVLCNNMEASSENNVVTQVDNLLPLGRISLKNEPTTESIPYALTLDELRLLTLNSYYCTQEVNYECSSSRITSENSTLLVWKGGDGLMHDYWNSQHKYGACQCYVENKKCDQNQRCNCDVNDRITRSDSTTLNNKDHLPIIGITAMDISSSTGKSATIEIGPLICVGVGNFILILIIL